MVKNIQDRKNITLGIDIGGTKTEVLVFDGALNRLSQARRPTFPSDPAKLVAGVYETILLALSEADVRREDVSGIGIAVPGLVDSKMGIVRQAVNLNLENFPLAAAISAAISGSKTNGIPAVLENDVRSGAVGAFEFLNRRRPVKSMAYLSIGTGIAAGLMLNGRLYRGATGMAGEIGHIIFQPDGYSCSCGLNGCFEAVAAGPAIARLGGENMGISDQEKPLSAEDVYLAAENGNPGAQKAIRIASKHIARGVQLLVMAYDIEIVAIGGGVSRAGEPFLFPVLEELSRLRSQSDLAREMLGQEKVDLIPNDYNPGAWGAVYLARKALEKEKI